MKYFICSDIHGSAKYAHLLLEQYHLLCCQKLILLGDILYHGPRNPLPKDYNPKEVASLLNETAADIIACRGNCDSEVDQMILQFPMLSDYTLICHNGTRLFASHGHILSPEKLPPLCKGDIFLFGHTHIQILEENDQGIVLCNPGSPSLPKGGSAAGFALFQDGTLSLHNLQGHITKEIKLQ
ncbi:MAG: phosphodiesterase [Spirochaetaceae bacterium]|nr:phosphodiesterase [Spirochaetaceae bacterium]